MSPMLQETSGQRLLMLKAGSAVVGPGQTSTPAVQAYHTLPNHSILRGVNQKACSAALL